MNGLSNIPKCLPLALIIGCISMAHGFCVRRCLVPTSCVTRGCLLHVALRPQKTSVHVHSSSRRLSAKSEKSDTQGTDTSNTQESETGAPLSLQPSSLSDQSKSTDVPASSNSPANENETNNYESIEDDIASVSTTASTTAAVAAMISRENKRILIEELGYRRLDVDKLKFEIAPVLVEKRIKCPVDGVPEAWLRSAEELAMEESAVRMQQRLELESKFPLKLPLLGISLILFGKGFSDALITIIKVNIDFPGVSLTEQFMGIPVLLIDAACVLTGACLGWWTWTNMK